MSANTLEIVDVYEILNDLHSQVTGRKTLAPTNTNEYVSMATSTLAVGTDIVFNTLMQTLGRTVFASRNYTGLMPNLRAEGSRWGGIMRKISFADKDAKADKVYHDIVDGTAVDMYIRNNADVLEMRFYGSASYQDWYTIYRVQFLNAFNDPEQLGSFIANMVQEWENKYTQWREELALGAVANFIGAKSHLDNGVIHLLTEYNTATGLTLTAQDVYKPANVKPFFEWVKARINTLSRLMTVRSGMFQVPVKDKKINRHTPYDKQKMYMTSQALDIINATVLSEAYHNEGLNYADVEGLPYWQNLQSPTSINVNASYINDQGVVAVQENVTVNNIFGLIFDEDAIAYYVKDESVDVTPYNARGKYYNVFLSSNVQYLNDLTEKGILLLLD